VPTPGDVAGVSCCAPQVVGLQQLKTL